MHSILKYVCYKIFHHVFIAGVAHTVPPSEASSSLVDPRTVHRISDPTDIVTLAKEVQKADEFVKAIATNKLIVIADQIRYLQDQVLYFIILGILMKKILLCNQKT